MMIEFRSGSLQSSLGAAIVVYLAASSVLASPTVSTVALSGQHAPGTTPGVTFEEFSAPALNAAGHTAFSVILSGSGVDGTNDRGIWSEGLGVLGMVARGGNQAPDTTDGIKYLLLGLPVLNSAGQVAFRATLTGSGVDFTNNRGLWSLRTGSLDLIARAGNPAPDTSSGVRFLEFNPLVMNEMGETAFSASLTGSGVDSTNNTGIWSDASGSLNLVSREGGAAPGTASGVNFRDFGSPALNANSQMAFVASLTGNGVNATNDTGLWVGHAGQLELVVRSGSQAPGTPSGVNYSGFSFSSPGLNAAGQAAFFATLTGSGVDQTNGQGIWSGTSGDLGLVARAGSPATDAPGTANFHSFIGAPVLNESGQTAFAGFLAGSSSDGGIVRGPLGIWSESTRALALVALEGEQAPGTASGVDFEGIVPSPVLNAAGQTVFLATVSGSGVTSLNDRGIWATDLDGELQLIVREGDSLEVAPSEFRIISTLGFIGGTGNGDGRASGFNDRGQLAFMASFTDGSSGVFVSNLVAVPEPVSLSLLVLGVISAYALRRRFSA